MKNTDIHPNDPQRPDATPSDPQSQLLVMLTTAEVGEQLRMSATTLKKLRRQGKGPKFIKLGPSVKYLPADVNAWLLSQRRKTTQPRKTVKESTPVAA